MNEKLKFCKLLGTNINVITMNETVDYMDQHLDELRGKYICVSNVHTTVMAFRDAEYRKVQNGSAMNLPDGKPLSIVCRMRGHQEAGRVPGPDLMPRIFELSEKKGYRHYFYGSTEKTLHALEQKLREKYPKLNIVGMYSPPFRPLTEEEDETVVKQINDTKPDFIWIGLGAPKQEKWMAAHAGMLHGVMLGVGAGFDFHAGTVRRAPGWMQELCLEWLFRLMQDPKRLIPRYMDTNFSFIHYVWKENKLLKKKNQELVHTPSRPKTGMKIAMIGHKRIPSREGGVEIVVEELSTRMVRFGNRVDAYNRSGYHVSGKEFDEKHGKYFQGIRIFTIPTFSSSKLNAIVYSFLATIRSLFGHYDIVHFHAEGPCIMLWLTKLFGIPTVATIHGLDWQRSKWGNFASHMLKLGEKTAALHADEVIVLSHNMQDYFQETYGRKTRFIPNGINRPILKGDSEIKAKYGLEKDGYILFLARIVPEKGLHYLLHAFEQIETDKKLVIAGGSSHSQEYVQEMVNLAAKDSRVIMTGFVQGEVLEELYSNAYCFVLPSDIEGMALGLLEAMSYGNCCIASNIPENTEVAEDHALYFEKGNERDLQKRLEEVLAHPEQTQKAHQENADFICGKYNWDRVTEQTLHLYQHVLKARENQK